MPNGRLTEIGVDACNDSQQHAKSPAKNNGVLTCMSRPKVFIVVIVAILAGLVVLLIILSLPSIIVGTINARPETNATSSTNYNFSSFAGTVWKTKIRTAIEDVKHYNGKQNLDLFPPEAFDTNLPQYTPVYGARMVGILPVGTKIRIDHLMKDNGAWGGVRVMGTVMDGTNAQTVLYVDRSFLLPNRFLSAGLSKSTNWGVNPEMLVAP
ncbi:MAG: hypothetical protein JWO95_2976 [Verrucomicrobiales bacterium]|nr:hypothetical protein [Verrucomicrobiales bacterium]